VVATLGYGIGAQLVAEHHDRRRTTRRSSSIPAAYTAGVLSSVTATGTSPPTVTLTGNSVDDFVGGRVEILSGGTRGTATFRYCLDYDATTGTGSGATLHDGRDLRARQLRDHAQLRDGHVRHRQRLQLHRRCARRTRTRRSRPAIDALYASGQDIGGVYIVSAPAGATTPTARRRSRPRSRRSRRRSIPSRRAATSTCGAVLQAGVADRDASSGAHHVASRTPVATMSGARAQAHGIAAGYGKQVRHRRAHLPPKRSAGASSSAFRRATSASTSDASLSGPVGTLLSIEHDEGPRAGSRTARAGQRYLTLRTHSNFTGFYVAESQHVRRGRSDYSKIERLRVINRAAKIGRAELVKRIGDRRSPTRTPAASSRARRSTSTRR
jgi:hypothetical protein